MYMYILHRESYGITNCFLFKGFALNFQVPIVLQDIPVGKQSISVYTPYTTGHISHIAGAFLLIKSQRHHRLQSPLNHHEIPSNQIP